MLLITSKSVSPKIVKIIVNFLSTNTPIPFPKNIKGTENVKANAPITPPIEKQKD